MKQTIISILTSITLTINFTLCPAAISSTQIPLHGGQASTALSHATIKGIKINPAKPFQFEFIINNQTSASQNIIKNESIKLVKYFLASLTTPDSEMWVNLSPYEKDRIIPDAFGNTLMGQDLLHIDYTLKQSASALTHPNTPLGQKFWNKVYEKARSESGISEIPLDIFNKIWIIPGDVLVYEQENSAFIAHQHLKVMLEEDYLALENNKEIKDSSLSNPNHEYKHINNKAIMIIREHIIPEIEREVNEGDAFANLRQIYSAMILASWYKKTLQQTLLSKVYVNQHKNSGINASDPMAVHNTYQDYLETFRRGTYNFIREDIDLTTREILPRQYFSGGITLAGNIRYSQNPKKIKPEDFAQLATTNQDWSVTVNAVPTTQKQYIPKSDPAMLTTATMKNPEARISHIDSLVKQIDQERKLPGSGNLPEIVAISDYHGEAKLFITYVADAISQRIGKTISLTPDRSIEEQLKQQHVNINDIKFKFFLLGDFLDRGAYGIKTFRIAEELKKLGLARYITGNHDLWAFLNVMGYHLPIYEGYNFYGNKAAEQAVKNHWNDPDIAENRIGWWTDKLAEYNARQKLLQGTIFNGDSKGTRKSFKDIYLHIKNQLTDEEKAVWEDLVGFYFGSTDVATGLNAVGMMSVQWWEDHLQAVYKMYKQAEETHNPLVIDIIQELQDVTGEAAEAVKKEYEKQIADGNWWWVVFDAINTQNYTSVEWWGKDWSSHSGWGTSVIKELNEKEGRERWNQANYIHNKDLRDLALFYRTNFNLFEVDDYGNVYTHAWLPIDETTGNVSFIYKNTIYSGKDVWRGLEAIQNDVRNLATPLSELHEALSLINSWYADKTTKLKPENIKTNVHKVGLEKIYNNIGIRTWFTSHNPLNKLQKAGISFKVQQGPFNHFSVDKGLSWQKYNDVGGYVNVDKNGIYMRGYASSDFHEVINNPATLLLSKSEDGSYYTKSSWENEPLSREDFLTQMQEQLMAEKKELEEWHQGGINLNPELLNMQIKKEPQGGFAAPNEQPIFNMNIEGLVPVIINITPAKTSPELIRS